MSLRNKLRIQEKRVSILEFFLDANCFYRGQPELFLKLACFYRTHSQTLLKATLASTEFTHFTWYQSIRIAWAPHQIRDILRCSALLTMLRIDSARNITAHMRISISVKLLRESESTSTLGLVSAISSQYNSKDLASRSGRDPSHQERKEGTGFLRNQLASFGFSSLSIYLILVHSEDYTTQHGSFKTGFACSLQAGEGPYEAFTVTARPRIALPHWTQAWKIKPVATRSSAQQFCGPVNVPPPSAFTAS